MRRLKESVFDPDDKELFADAGACVTCSRRSGNEEDLFKDVKSADVCTDPNCYRIKVDRWNQKTIAEAEKSGHHVIRDKALKKEVFPWANASISDNYKDMSQCCYDDPKHRKFEALLGKADVKFTYVVDPAGKLRKLLRADQVKEALKKSGYDFRTSSGDSSSRSSVADRAERKKLELKKVCVPIIMTKILEKFAQDKTGGWWKTFAERLLEKTDHDTRRYICVRRDPKVKSGEAEETVEKILKETPDEALPALCFEMAMTEPIMGYHCGYGDAMIAAAKHYGVDIKAIEIKVAAAKAEKAKAPKKGKRAEKPVNGKKAK